MYLVWKYPTQNKHHHYYINKTNKKGYNVKYVKADRKARKAETEALKKGVQAILRNQMITNYNKWHEDKGYAPIWVKDNFENLWLQYEALGENGVMKELHDKFMKLPTEPPKKK